MNWQLAANHKVESKSMSNHWSKHCRQYKGV